MLHRCAGAAFSANITIIWYDPDRQHHDHLV